MRDWKFDIVYLDSGYNFQTENKRSIVKLSNTQKIFVTYENYKIIASCHGFNVKNRTCYDVLFG